MTHTTLTTSAVALLAIGALTSTSPAAATEPTLLAAPTQAAQQAVFVSSDAGPTEAELRRLRNELRFEVRGTLTATLDDAFATALDDSIVVTE